MALSPGERESFIKRYEEGPKLLRAAWEAVPVKARQWRPAPGEWSAHEVVCHCGDSETQAASRIRILAVDKAPLILGYDEAAWARDLDYHQHPPELALTAVEAVRANTAVLLRRLPESAWSKVGRHTESGRYGAEDWLRIYAEHLELHSRQIESAVAAWRQRGG